jgi:hypothetical protein
MTYFADLTPYKYTGEDEHQALNVGWLGWWHRFPKEETAAEFRQRLAAICSRPIGLSGAVHTCEYCWFSAGDGTWADGQIRVQGRDGTWYAAPTMIHHYVTVHHYRPPDPFIAAVLSPRSIATAMPGKATAKVHESVPREDAHHSP